MTVRIETIDDVLPHIPRDKGIVISERGDYTVIDYVYVTDDTFINPVACECRGLKFGADGRILARPFHKFFNMGEREAPQSIDWGQPHVVMDKLDGSMIHPCMLGGRMAFMTRMGETGHGKAAFNVAGDPVKDLCHDMLQAGVTPIFEYTSPDNRIVLPYEETRLTLLAARDNVEGTYHSHADLRDLGERYGVATVETFGTVDDIGAFIKAGRALEGVEGYVIAFENGHRIKLKSDAYVLRHKALAGVAYEKNLLAWIVDDALDDVLPILNPEVADRVRVYRDEVMAQVNARLAEIEAFVAAHAGQDRRTFAIAAQQTLDKRVLSVAFAIIDGRDGREALMKILGWAAHSETRLNTVRDIFGMSWQGNDLVLQDT